MSTNVVAMWRRRAQRLGRQGFACSACGHLYLVQRPVCPACDATAGFVAAPLPVRATVRAVCRAGASVEHLDQVSDQKAAVLLELPGGVGNLACLVASVDAPILDSLRDTSLRIGIRRMALGHVPTDEPIQYGLKAVADVQTRLAAKRPPEPSAREAD
jgi:hypothetical protein